MKKFLLLIYTSALINCPVSDWTDVGPFPRENLYSIKFINSLTGYAAGKNGLIIKTTNAGKPWSTLNSGTTSDKKYNLNFCLSKITFID